MLVQEHCCMQLFYCMQQSYPIQRICQAFFSASSFFRIVIDTLLLAFLSHRKHCITTPPSLTNIGRREMMNHHHATGHHPPQPDSFRRPRGRIGYSSPSPMDRGNTHQTRVFSNTASLLAYGTRAAGQEHSCFQSRRFGTKGGDALLFGTGNS